MDRKKVLIVGSDDSGLMAAKIAELQAQNPRIKVVTIGEAKEHGLSQTFEITAPLLLPEIEFKPDPTRKERRKQERKNKKIR